MSVPMVPQEQVLKLLRYRLPNPLDDTLHEYADYLGKPFPEVLEEYRRLESSNFTELLGPDIHLLCLLVAPLRLPHLFRRLQTMLALAPQHPNSSFLDIGAGCGRDCIAFARCGCRVTHADIPWEGMDFARWRYAQRGLNVRCVNVLELPEERFNLIGCHDVFEHVSDPVELMVRFATHLEPEGLLYASLDLFNPIPTHRPANDFYITLYDPLLKRLGLELALGRANPILDAASASMRVYRRTRPALLSVADEYAQNYAEAYTFAQGELQQLSDRFNAELDQITRKGFRSCQVSLAHNP